MQRSRALAIGVALATAILVAACSGPETASDATLGSADRSTPDTVARTPTPDCTPARPHASGASDEEAAGPDGAINFIVHTPASYDGVAPMAVVLNYHGGGSTPQRQLDYSQLAVTAEARGFLLVAPPNSAPTSAVLDHLEANWCVDTARVFSTGMSAGARVSSALGCELAGRIAAIAPVAGLDYTRERCDGTAPTPVVAFHGTADRILVFQGARDAVIAWANHNGCDPRPIPEHTSESVSLTRYTNCDAGADVELYAIEAGGHTWPGAQPRDDGPLGATTSEISANDLMWAFFEAHPLR